MGFVDRFFSKPPSKDKFAAMLLERIKRAGESRTVVYDEDEFRLRASEKAGGILNLGNLYLEYCDAARAMRPAVLKKFVRVWFTHHRGMPDDFEDVRPDLLLSVQTRSGYELFTLELQLQGHEAPDRPFTVLGEHFAVGLVYDLPETMSHITQKDLDKWGVTLYEAFEAGRENLAQLQFAVVGPEEGEGLWCSMAKDSYDAARILLVDVIRRFRVKGDIVAMIPNRETLLVTGADDLQGLKGMLNLATEAIQQPRGISGIALGLVDGEWAPWLPEDSHPLYWDFRKLQIESFGREYADQKQVLDKLHQAKGEDVFVASFSGMGRNGTEELFSFCVWGKDVLTLLPRADLVVFSEEGRDPRMVSWDRAVETVGDMMEPMGMYPERYRVFEFPSDEQLNAMMSEESKECRRASKRQSE
ncbi:MAG: DUF1444 domain-containing protein [Pirellulales bacterium]